MPAAAVQEYLAGGERIVWASGLEAPMLIRYNDIREALSRPAVGALGIGMLALAGWTEGPFIDAFQRWLVTLDEPGHGRLRRLVSGAFTPHRITRIEQIVRSAAERLTAGFERVVELDLYDDFASPLALTVVSEGLGIPRADDAELQRWVRPMVAAMGTPTPEERAAADEAMVRFTDYVVQLVEERRRHLGDDLLSSMIQAEEHGDRLTNDELVATVANLLFGGQETTRDLIGGVVFTLLSHPGDLRCVRADPGLTSGAVEEVLRYEPPIVHVVRPARGGIPIGGTNIPDGQYVIMNIAAANRDPRVFSRPNTFDLTRRDNHHLAFSWGPHYCVGASIARLEARVALETLLSSFPSLELIDPSPSWTPFTVLRTLESLRVHARKTA
jgi:cytochrome P450